MTVADVPGVELAGLIFDAGPTNSPVLLQVGTPERRTRATRPTRPRCSDVFFRIGGAAAGKATTSLEVNSDNVILDHIWAWRADHGNGVGWTVNTADTGVIVNGDNVTAYGLFVEHYQKYEVIWNGQNGTGDLLPERDAVRPAEPGGVDGAPGVAGLRRLQGRRRRDAASAATAWAATASSTRASTSSPPTRSRSPTTLPAGSLHDLLTIFLDPSNGKGGILNVVNDTGGSSTIANPDVPVTVVSYP